MRGKGAYTLGKAQRTGITPARAGKSELEKAAVYLEQDHPRACGEKGSIVGMPMPVAGSPPRVRGKDA